MVAFLYRMPAGIPGECTRAQSSTIEPEVITPAGTTGAPTAYGLPVVLDATSGMVRTMVAADTAVYGILIRPFPTGNSQDGLGTSTPPSVGVCDVLRRGYVNVLLGGSAAAVKGGAVYIWTAVSASPHVQGTFEAATSSGNTITVPNARFVGPADANGNVEIQFFIGP